MVASADSIMSIVKRYIEELRKHDIPVREALLFGSYVKGTIKEESDIDVALISDVFTGDRFEDRRKIVPLRRTIDNRIEPTPFSPMIFARGGILVHEIKRTGVKVPI
jgi:predicted nucleotidyltransferase